MNEEEIYELISEEIESSSSKKGLWTKAFSESEGDEQKTRALYIKYRFDQIKQTQPQVDQETIVRDDEEKVTEKKVSNEYKIKLSDRVIKEEKSLGHYYDSVQPPEKVTEKKVSNEYKIKLSDRVTKEEKSLGHYYDSVQPPEKSLGHYDSGQPPEKFGGFLLFLAYVLPIGFILAPLSALLSLGQLTGMTYRANAEIKEAVRTFSSQTMISQVCLTLFFVYLLYLFYKKKRNFPKLYSWTIILNWLISTFLLINFYNVLEKYLPKDFVSNFFINLFSEPKIIIPLLFNLVLLIYFNYSTRVKNTFTQ